MDADANNPLPEAPPVYREEFIVPPSSIDANGHVNNVVFVQWMQDIATRHFESARCMEALRLAHAAWVARSHMIEYLGPAFAGDRLESMTWVLNFSRVRSRRRYQFRRVSDSKLLVHGETDWVLVNIATGRPCSIPESIRRAFTLVEMPD